MKNYLNLILLVLTTSLPSQHLMANSDTLPAKGEVEIAAGKIKEVCFPAKSPMQINYQFSANQALNFNIHFHQDKNAYFPIKQNDILSTQGIFTPESEQFYCMMWSNKNKQAVTLKYQANLEK